MTGHTTSSAPAILRRSRFQSEVVADALVAGDGSQGFENGKVDRLVDRALRSVGQSDHKRTGMRAAEAENAELGWTGDCQPGYHVLVVAGSGRTGRAEPVACRPVGTLDA